MTQSPGSNGCGPRHVERDEALESLAGHARALAASPNGAQPIATDLIRIFRASSGCGVGALTGAARGEHVARIASTIGLSVARGRRPDRRASMDRSRGSPAQSRSGGPAADRQELRDQNRGEQAHSILFETASNSSNADGRRM